MKKIVYVDMDNVLVDFGSGIRRLPAHVREQYGDRLDDAPGIFSLMDPVPGAVDAFAELCALFDTYVLSTAPWENPTAWVDKLLWVKGNLGSLAYKRLILTHHKDLNRGDFLIDDRKTRGAEAFEGELLTFGPDGDYPDWRSVMGYLRTRA